MCATYASLREDTRKSIVYRHKKEGMSMKRYGTFVSDESKTLLQNVRHFVDKEIMPVRLELDESREACEKVIKKLVDLGMQKYGLSPKYGGGAHRLCSRVLRGLRGTCPRRFRHRHGNDLSGMALRPRHEGAQ